MVDEERLLDARIKLDGCVKLPDDGWQQRYCETIGIIARHYSVSEADLAGAFIRHHGLELSSMLEAGNA